MRRASLLQWMLILCVAGRLAGGLRTWITLFRLQDPDMAIGNPPYRNGFYADDDYTDPPRARRLKRAYSVWLLCLFISLSALVSTF